VWRCGRRDSHITNLVWRCNRCDSHFTAIPISPTWCGATVGRDGYIRRSSPARGEMRGDRRDRRRRDRSEQRSEQTSSALSSKRDQAPPVTREQHAEQYVLGHARRPYVADNTTCVFTTRDPLRPRRPSRSPAAHPRRAVVRSRTPPSCVGVYCRASVLFVAELQYVVRIVRGIAHIDGRCGAIQRNPLRFHRHGLRLVIYLT
jgi:hypothetical protein